MFCFCLDLTIDYYRHMWNMHNVYICFHHDLVVLAVGRVVWPGWVCSSDQSGPQRAGQSGLGAAASRSAS